MLTDITTIIWKESREFITVRPGLRGGWAGLLIILAVALFSSVLILFQRPFWIQYFSYPIPILVLCIASGYHIVSGSRKKVVMILITVLSLISITTGSRILFSSIGHLWNTSSWTPVKVFRISKYLRRQINQNTTKEFKKIAMLRF